MIKDIYKTLIKHIPRLFEDKFIIIFVLLGLLLRLIWIFAFNTIPVGDFLYYFERAVDISKGYGYSVNGNSVNFYPVGYPAFLGLILWIFGGGLFTAKLVNVFLSVGIVILTYHISNKLFNSKNIAKIALVLIALYPNHIAYCSIISTEIYYTFLLMLISYLIIKSFNKTKQHYVYVIIGILTGLATLTKPQIFLLPIFLLIVFMIFSNKVRITKKRIIYSYSIIILVSFLTITPWIIRNYLTYNKIILFSSHGGVNLLMGNNPFTKGEYSENIAKDIITNETDSAKIALAKIILEQKTEIEWDKASYELAMKYIARDNITYLKYWPKKIFIIYYGGNDAFWIAEATDSGSAIAKNILHLFRKLANLYYYTILLLFVSFIIFVLFSRFKNKLFNNLFFLGILIVIFFNFVNIIYISINRYNFPLTPFITIYSSFMVYYLLDKYVSKNKKLEININ